MRSFLIAALIGLVSLHSVAQKTEVEEQAFLTVQADQQAFLDNLGINEQELYDLIQSYMLIRLQRTLDLNDVQTLELMKLNGQFKDQLTRLKFQRGMLIAQLRLHVQANESDDVLSRTLEHILENESQTAVTLRKLVEESASLLSVPQQAQLYLFVGDFEQDIRRMATHAKRIEQDGHSEYTRELHSEFREFTEESERTFRDLVRQKTQGVDIKEPEKKNIIELVDAWLVVRLTDELELTKEETVLLFAEVGTYKDQLHEMKWQMADARDELRAAIREGADPEIIKTQLDDMLLREHAIVELSSAFIHEAQNTVSIHRSAQLFLFLGEFELEVIDLLERAHAMALAN